MRKLLVAVFTLIFLAVLWLAIVDPVGASGYHYSYPSYSYYTPTYYQTQYVYKEVPYYKEYPIYKEVTIPRYAVVPLYSVHYDPKSYPQNAPCNGNGHAAQPSATPNVATPNPAAAPANNTCAAAEAKVAKLEIQLELLMRLLGEGKGDGLPPGAVHTPGKLPVPRGKVPTPKAPPPKAPIPKEKVPPPEKEPEVKEPTSAQIMQEGVNAFYVNCASCHDKAKAATDGGNFAMFDKVNLLNLTERQWAKVSQEIKEGGMPPKKDKDGKVIPTLPKAEVDRMNAFLSERKKLVARGE